ncbi:hypothetical protein HY994_02255 [Candidatus Micrarchaeota archaeon]|nr:hypothetical protein [Candidatus Micrarchaeota archaeon]
MSFSELVERCVDRIHDFLADLDEYVQNIDEKKQLRFALIGAMLLILFVSFIVMIPKSSFGMTILVSDEQDRPINGASVQLFDLDGFEVANASTENGRVNVRLVSTVPYQIRASHPDYRPSSVDYTPDNPLSAVIRLKTISNSDANGLSAPTPPPFGPLPLPSPPVVIPTHDDRQSDFADYDSFKQGAYQSDARLRVSVKDKQNSKPVFNAIVTLKDASTSAFLVQGQTNQSGFVDAGVKKDSSIIVKVAADGYALVESQTVAIANETLEVGFLLLSQGSSGAALTRVIVLDQNRNALPGARVQIYSSPPIVDELTSVDGRVSAYLETGKKFNLLATKQNYQDVSKNFTSGESVELTLQLLVSNQSVPAASVLVNVTDVQSLPSKSALIGLFKRVGGNYVPFSSATANENGLAQFQGLEADWTIRINATAASGIPSSSKDINLTAGTNNVVLSLNYTTQNNSSNSSNNTSPNNQTIHDNGTVQNVTAMRFFVCTQAANGPTYFAANGFNYSLSAISSSNTAAFVVRNNQSVLCSAFSPDCTYALGQTTAGNDALAKLTNANISLISIQVQKACVNVSATVICSGSSCNATPVCPQARSPVCGSNGITYLNSCEASLDRVAFISGSCPSTCTDQFDPVCAINGIQYVNSCKAISANVPYKSGVCLVPIGSINVDVPAGWSAIAPPNSGTLLATNCTIGDAYLFQGYDGTIREYFTVKPTFNTSAIMSFGSGYLTYSERACRLYWENKTDSSTYQKELKPGWNLVGAPAEPIKIKDVSGNCSTAVFYSVFGSTDLAQYGTRLTSEDLLQPGRGYWVSTAEANRTSCTLWMASNVCPNGGGICPDGSTCQMTPKSGTNGVSCIAPDETWTQCGKGQVCPAGLTCSPILTLRPCSLDNPCPLYACTTKPTPTPAPSATPVPEPDKQLHLCHFAGDASMIFGSYDYRVVSDTCPTELGNLGPFGKIYATNQPNTAPIYYCGIGLSRTTTCNSPDVRLLGYTPINPTTGFELVYRCMGGRNVALSIFYTFSPICDDVAGAQVAETVGYFKRA